MALRRSEGYVRYALAVQYHGASFLGFTDQGDREDCIVPDGTDLRGYRSVEGRLKEALGEIFDYTNIQVSSRTDRGVHALKNTFHVDIIPSQSTTTVVGNTDNDTLIKLHRGLNFYLSRQANWWQKERTSGVKKPSSQLPPYTLLGGDEWRRHSMDELKILSAMQAPDIMPNPYSEQDPRQPATVDWNVRFSATERTYIYRMLWFSDRDGEWGVPFEWDRSWRVKKDGPINMDGMRQAATILEGTQDFSSFRAARCQRSSPLVTIKSIDIHAEPYGIPGISMRESSGGGLLGLGSGHSESSSTPTLVTVKIVGDSFLYRQVRNMVACLVDVGRNQLNASDVRDILNACDRSAATGMAPAHGLFLVDVNHGDFDI
jgi:tRNA pseudouridine(38-40) synthase